MIVDPGTGAAPHNRLFALLPVIHRQRDLEQRGPLEALLGVIAAQVDVVEEDIRQLYDNWFVETAQDWVVPYLGDLIGYEPVHEAGEPGGVATPQSRARNKILIPRREVANTIRYRRRKGTLALLELLAADVAGWPAARAVQFFTRLAQTQRVGRLTPARGRLVDVRRSAALDRLGGPFDPLAHTVDVRGIGARDGGGRHNIPHVGLFIWRLRPYVLHAVEAACLEGIGPHAFTFSVLGNDAPLFTVPRPEDDPTMLAGELNVPAPIRRRALRDHLDAYYGPDKSIHIWRGVRQGGGIVRRPVPREDIVVANLEGWYYRTPPGRVAVDPVLGRIAFPYGQSQHGVWVTYAYGFSADLGGGPYRRPMLDPRPLPPGPGQDPPAPFFRVVRLAPGSGEVDSVARAVEEWYAVRDQQPHAVIEIGDDGVYNDPLRIEVAKGQSIQIRAASGKRPLIDLLNRMRSQPDTLAVTSEPLGSPYAERGGGCVTLDGLLIAGRGIHVEGAVADLRIRHCTLVPGWEIGPDCDPRRPAEPSLELYHTNARVDISHTILGSIQVHQDEVQFDPLDVSIADSVLDATSAEREALGAPGCPLAHVVLTVVRSTVFGRVQVYAIALAENSIFTGPVTVLRRQHGCVRFCSLPTGSRTPRRYQCQPDLVERAIVDRLKGESAARGDPPPPDAALAAARERERLRVRPRFNSVRYGRPAYCQLAAGCAAEIRRGADDESEMGVFHDLYQAQREANLRVRLDEYLPANSRAGVIFVT